MPADGKGNETPQFFLKTSPVRGVRKRRAPALPSSLHTSTEGNKPDLPGLLPVTHTNQNPAKLPEGNISAKNKCVS